MEKTYDMCSIEDHTWHIQPCCALTGEGLYTGMDWVSAHVASMS
jgi:hypothetical protein